MLYHVSPEQGLKVLYPRVSTHKKAYVYAIENMVTGLLFGTKQDDFDFIISTDENQNPIVYECYPDAFRTIYYGKKCSVYIFDDKGFQRNRTSWEPEFVCETEVAVQSEIFISDIYKRLLEEESLGHIYIHRYEFNDEYRKRISVHIVDRLIRFNIDLNNCLTWDDNRFSMYYKGIIEELLSIYDGNLLQ